MSALFALALVSAAAASEDNPAIRAFKEACVEGSLKLSPARGRILEDREITEFMQVWDWGRVKARRTVVQLNESPASYLVLVEYNKLQPGSIARSCALLSKSVSKGEAMTTFLQGIPEKYVPPTWVRNMYRPTWTSDHPELGYRKKLVFRDDAVSILLEIGMYPIAAAQMNPGASKQ
jgi:hypothetical protein